MWWYFVCKFNCRRPIDDREKEEKCLGVSLRVCKGIFKTKQKIIKQSTRASLLHCMSTHIAGKED